MVIQVTGTGPHNKGAELMLVAIREHYIPHPAVKVAISNAVGTYEYRARHNVWLKPNVDKWGRSRIALSLMPASFRNLLGLVTDKEVNVVMDASGFALSDSWGRKSATLRAERFEAARRSGKKVILLPQALGPFEDLDVRDAFRRIVDASDLVFARDGESLGYARLAVGDRQNLRLAPDFTNLVEVAPPGQDEKLVCIVPNTKMLDRASSEAEAGTYVPFLAHCVDLIHRRGLRPVVLVHSAQDAVLVDEIEHASHRRLGTHQEEDPVAIKRFIGCSRLVIGSRFHALVCALAQGVPCIATSWSHKYEMLFRDYGCEHLVLQIDADEDQLNCALKATLGDGRMELVQKIVERGKQQMAAAREMWTLVDQAIGIGRQQ